MSQPSARSPRARQVRSGAALLAVPVLAAGVLAGCGSSSKSSTATTTGSGEGAAATTPASDAGVTIRVGDQEQRLQTLLQAAGQLQGLPYKISWAEFPSGPPMLQALEAGSLDVASVGDTPPIFAAAAGGGGADLRIIGAASTVGNDTNAILVPKNSSITSVSQLKGKKVAVTRGSSGHLTLLLALEKAGLTWGDISPIYLQPTAAQPAFAQGSIAAWSVWYPFVSVAVAQGAKVIETGASLDPGYNFYVSDTSSIGNAGKSAAMGDLIHRIALADEWAKSNIATWAKDFSGISELSLTEATSTVTHNLAVEVPVDATVTSSLQQAANSFTAAGLIAHVDMAAATTDQYASEVPASS